LPMAARTEAAGIFSLMRNIGSSVGISIVMTLLARGTQINHAELASRITPFDPAVAHLAATMHLPQATAIAALNAEITRQAAAISFLNDFWMMMIMTIVAMPLLLLLRPVRQRSAPAIVADH
jgi:DHA2 family multidrug resistance protein